MRGVRNDGARVLAAVYEEAALKLKNADLRAFVLHQSAWLATLGDAKSKSLYIARSRRHVTRLVESGRANVPLFLPVSSDWAVKRLAAGYAVLSADPASQWAIAHLPGHLGHAIGNFLTLLPNVT